MENESTDDGQSKPLSLGLWLQGVDNIEPALDEAIQDGFDFVCVRPYHARYSSPQEKSAVTGLTQSTGSADCLMPGARWSTAVVGCMSERTNITCTTGDSSAVEAAWKQELSWCAYLSVPAVMLPEVDPAHASLTEYCRAVAQAASAGAVHLWMPVPMVYPPGVAADGQDGWHVWNAARTAADSSACLSPILIVTAHLPSQADIQRWLAEPLKAAVFPTHLFVPNAAGYPVLPKAHQSLLHLLYRHGVQCVISGSPLCPPGIVRHTPYVQYMRYAASRAPALTPQEQFESPYFDVLQAPLQPLADNLECATYEVFERDSPKYVAYEDAMVAAMHRQPTHKAVLTVMVVGAGRGPLIVRALSASARSGRPIRVIAVEKNPNAVITLQEMARMRGWGEHVTIVAEDMREWASTPDACADLLISELLGSFGDNELSPECLSPVLSLLQPGTGRCIPQAYTSFLAPVSASAAWSGARAYHEPKWLETPFVARLRRFALLDAPQPVFTFAHAGPADGRTISALCDGMPIGDCGVGPATEAADGAQADHRRHVTLRFTSSCSALLHGFAGYFDSALTDGVRLSIHPANHTPGMSSWFPLYFPIRDPIRVVAGQTVVVHMWRCSSRARRAVWYEWCVAEPVHTHVHNANGSAYTIRL